MRCAAATALLALLSDPHACRVVSPQQGLALASSLEPSSAEGEPEATGDTVTPEEEVTVSVVNALDDLLASNPGCASAIIERLDWFPSRIAKFLSTKGGKHGQSIECCLRPTRGFFLCCVCPAG